MTVAVERDIKSLTLTLSPILPFILQPCDRFINARRRILQPMLDNANPDGAKKKPKPPQTRPQKYWPENLAQLSQNSTTAEGREDGGRLTNVQHRISMSSGILPGVVIS